MTAVAREEGVAMLVAMMALLLMTALGDRADPVVVVGNDHRRALSRRHRGALCG